MAAQPRRLVCYDLVRLPQVDQLAALACQTEFVFRQEDPLRAELEETDLLFIDTRHSYDQLKEELRRHASRVRRYLVLHDTTTFGNDGEAQGQRGLWPAVEELLADLNDDPVTYSASGLPEGQCINPRTAAVRGTIDLRPTEDGSAGQADLLRYEPAGPRANHRAALVCWER